MPLGGIRHPYKSSVPKSKRHALPVRAAGWGWQAEDAVYGGVEDASAGDYVG